MNNAPTTDQAIQGADHTLQHYSIDHALLPSIHNATLPEVYLKACTVMAECSSIDECKDWADKTAALASYAKMSDDDTLMKFAMRIQSRAIRKCGELLRQIKSAHGANQNISEGDHTNVTRTSMAKSAGMSKHQQVQAVRVAAVPHSEFAQLVESDNPPTVTKLAEMGRKKYIIDLKGRDPKAYNRAMHFCGMLRYYLDDLKKYEVASITEDLDDKEKAKVTHFIAQIDSIHDQYKASCGTEVSP
jgi:hypothetical protein